MATAHKVVICGDSLVLAGMGRSLQKYPQLEVTSIRSSPELSNLHPDAVILDLGVTDRESAFDLMRDHPDLLLIGLDPGGDRLLVLSGQQARALTTEDLVRLIDRPIDQP